MPHVTGYLVCSVIFNLSLCPQRPIWQTAFPPGSHLPGFSVPAALFAIVLNIVLPPDEKSEVEIAEEILDIKRQEEKNK